MTTSVRAALGSLLPYDRFKSFLSITQTLNGSNVEAIANTSSFLDDLIDDRITDGSVPCPFVKLLFGRVCFQCLILYCFVSGKRQANLSALARLFQVNILQLQATSFLPVCGHTR